MGSKDGEEQCNTETEEETVARQKKRSRRVSFAAEITSVHVFNRDDDCETPTESKPTSESSTLQLELGLPDAPVLSLLKDLGETTDEDDDDNDDDHLHQRKSFLRPFQSPSPGSTIGSVTSNDDGKFRPLSEFQHFPLDCMHITNSFFHLANYLLRLSMQKTIFLGLYQRVLLDPGDYLTLLLQMKTMILPWTPQHFLCIFVVLHGQTPEGNSRPQQGFVLRLTRRRQPTIATLRT